MLSEDVLISFLNGNIANFLRPMHRYHCVHRTFSNSTPRLSPSTDQLYISLLSLDQSKLYFSDICKSWRVNIYLVFLERKGGPMTPVPPTIALSLTHICWQEKITGKSETNKDCILHYYIQHIDRDFEICFFLDECKISKGMSIPFPVCSYPILHLKCSENGN